MPLVTFNFFATINSSFFAGVLSFHALCINDAITGYGTASSFLTRKERQLIQAFLPDTTLVPPAKMIVNSLPGRKIVRHQPPLDTAFDNIQNGIHNGSFAMFVTIATFADRIKERIKAKQTAIEAQKKECHRWENLHELIGSADGKKYRNFAQGLTFEMMIGHANRQLQKMTDRYLLVRDDAQPLELNVVDNYQAGEIRSTKNLSGGESFIVSLSLALGLSHMASKNVRVDSLFLDEGFGTLDEEALDTALETLAGLQQDGKLIGVISHVPALKERISTQIQVTPQTGGRSQISGPGCCRNGSV